MDMLLLVATLVSLTFGTAMSAIAWRLSRQNAERRAARIEVLQAMSGGRAPESVEPDYQYADPATTGRADLFATPDRAPAGHWRARLAIVVSLAGGAAIAYGLYSQGVFGGTATAAPAGDARPIELLSLRHTTDELGSFTVTGLVQNPVGGRKTTDIIAVVYLFDEGARLVATGRAALDIATLQPGDEAAFMVSIPKAAAVVKYRVGFRHADGGVVPHVDRRGQPPADTTEDAVGHAPGRPPVTAPLAGRRSEGV